MRYILALLILAGCSTPVTMLEKDGQVVRCGGNVSSSMAGGAIGYEIQKSNDKKCVADYMSQGFKTVR